MVFSCSIDPSRAFHYPPAGKTLYANTHQSFSDIEKSLSSFKPVPNPRTLTLSTTPTFAVLWLTPRLGTFYREHPDIQVNVLTNKKHFYLNRTPTVDIVIRGLAGEHPDLYQLPLMNESFGVYTNPLAVCAISPESQVELISMRVPDETTAAATWDLWCAAAGHEKWLEHSTYREYDNEHYALQAAISEPKTT